MHGERLLRRIVISFAWKRQDRFDLPGEHGLHHVSDDWGEDLARVLRIAIGK
jgi:hypothetical protein